MRALVIAGTAPARTARTRWWLAVGCLAAGLTATARLMPGQELPPAVPGVLLPYVPVTNDRSATRRGSRRSRKWANSRGPSGVRFMDRCHCCCSLTVGSAGWTCLGLTRKVN